MKKDYIYWNDKGYHFFKSEPEMARDYVVNHFDMSYEPSYSEVLAYELGQFTVHADLYALRLKKHFNLSASGEHVFIFKNR